MGPGGPSGPPVPKNFNENRENMAGPNREKFFTDEYGARNRMSSMNIGNPHDEGIPNNRAAGAGPAAAAGGLPWPPKQSN